ncbi:MAG: hypothetical protein JWP38_1920 [Herbaspirillum sp.]|jgi:hypothetical protein|nr:hypothetical protein [Herbaspirillum sp.]
MPAHVKQAALAEKPVRKESAAKTMRPKYVKTMSTVKFGGVSVKMRTPTPTEIKKRVAESRAAAGRLINAIATPGVKLSLKKTTPIFVADSKNPKLVIRKLGGEQTLGEFQNGIFVAVR